MTTYRVIVTSVGKITQPLDSQKIFGAMVYLLANHLKKEEIDKFISEISNNNRIFMVSDLLPVGYLPTPHGDVENGNKDAYKELKRKKFIPIDSIEKEIATTKNFIEIKEGQDAKYRINNEFFDIPGLKSDLFSVPTMKILKRVENLDDEDSSTIMEVKDFNFYLAFDEEDEIVSKLLELLQQVAKDKDIFLYGQKASQGYNVYKVKKRKRINNLSWENPACFLNLGMFLPNNKKQVIDYHNSKLKLFTSERRPYQMDAGQGQFERDNNFISFIEAGSVIKLKENIEELEMIADKLRNVGKSVSTPYGEKRIVFGQSFLYPLKEEPKL